MSSKIPAILCGVLAVGAFACTSGSRETYVWKRPCGTDAQREADRRVCMSESAGIADPSGYSGVEYARDLFDQCMESRGWQQMPADAMVECR